MILSGLIIMPPGVATESSTHLKDGTPFESEALANRALHYVHAFVPRVRSLVNRWFAGSKAARIQSENSLHQPVDILGFDRAVGVGQEPDWDVGRLHAAAVDSLEALKMLVDFAVIPPPWIKDLTGQFGVAPTLAETAAFVRENPTALAFFHWPNQDAPIVAQWVHEIEGGILPLPPSAEMEYLRERLRDIRVIWVLTDPATSVPSNHLRAAADELLSFAGTLWSVRAIDPSLGVLASADEEESVGYPRSRPVDNDFTLIQRALDEAVDVAVWQGETEVALRLLKEAGRFSESQIEAVAARAEKVTYRRLAMQTDEISRELAHTPDVFAAATRERVWRDANLAAYDALKGAIGAGVIVIIPGEDVGVTRIGGDVEVVATVASPDDPPVDLAPWLYGIDLSVLQPVKFDSHDQTPAVSGLPIAVVDLGTGIRRIRRLVHDESESPEFELSTAHFRNLTAGTYRIELVPWRSDMSVRRRDSPSDDPTPSLRQPRWRRALTRVSRTWRLRWFVLTKYFTRRFSTKALGSAA